MIASINIGGMKVEIAGTSAEILELISKASQELTAPIQAQPEAIAQATVDTNAEAVYVHPKYAGTACANCVLVENPAVCDNFGKQRCHTQPEHFVVCCLHPQYHSKREATLQAIQ